MRGGGCALLAFATFWTGFVAVWTAGASGVFRDNGPRLENVLFAAFSIPFWIVGFGVLGAVVWMAFGRKSVRIDREAMRTHWKCLMVERSKVVDRVGVQYVRHHDRKVKSEGQPSWALEIVHVGGSFSMPVNSEDEEKWLIAEINDFLKHLKPQGNDHA